MEGPNFHVVEDLLVSLGPKDLGLSFVPEAGPNDVPRKLIPDISCDDSNQIGPFFNLKACTWE
jgi:hypothetical protein